MAGTGVGGPERSWYLRGVLRVAHVVMPRPDERRPVLEYAWAATRYLHQADVEVRTVVPLPASTARGLQNVARRFKGAAPWPRTLESAVKALRPRPEVLSYVPLVGASLDAAADAAARDIGAWADVWIGSILDEAGYVAVRAARTCGARSVAVAHGTDARAAAGASRAPAAERSRWTLEHAGRVIAVSSQLQETVSTLRRDAVVLPFTVFAADFPFLPRLPSSPTRLLFVGRRTRAKGLDVLLSARNHAMRFELTIVGAPGDVDVPPDLGRVVGEVAQDALPAIYEGSHGLVLPSRAEGLGNVLVESMLTGRPVLAAAVGGVIDVVTPEAGVLVTGHDPWVWSRALDGFVDAIAAERFDPAVIRRAAEPFTWEAQGPRLLDVLASKKMTGR